MISERKTTNSQRYLELLALTLAFGSLFHFIYYFNQLPAEVPVHFGIDGTPDRFGNKIVLGIVPVLNVLLLLGLQLLIKKPQYFNYPVAVTEANKAQLEAIGQSMLRSLGLMVSLLLGYISFGAVNSGLGKTSGLNLTVMLVLLALLVFLLTYYYRKMLKAK